MQISAVCAVVVSGALVSVAGSGVFAQRDYKSTLPPDHPAIKYADGPVSNAVEQLIARLLRENQSLVPREGMLRYLPSVLEHLALSPDSQLLVFSKTSFQAQKVAPDNPRAIYFNDEVAVAYVPGAANLELMAVDPARGPIFYVLTQAASGRPTITRSGVCLRCHQGPSSAGVPGPYVGSVIPGPTGVPLRDESAVITDHRSAFEDRWGGWYVTARRGEQPDRANAVALNPAEPEMLVRESQQNIVSLAGRFPLGNYVAPTSDIVALMTFEHQTQMTNLITRVGWLARMAEHPSGATVGVSLDADLAELVDYLLFEGEARLKEPIEGVSSFTQTFPVRGPRDRRGRSLRDFDLKTRLFRYPLSYMIYSEAFDALPAHVRDRIYRHLYEILTGRDKTPKYAYISSSDREAIFEILRDTKSALPRYWTAEGSASTLVQGR